MFNIEKQRLTNPEGIQKRYAKKFGAHWFKDKEERYEKMFFKDIPMMVAEDGSIVCIPKTEEIKTISITGLSGTGKTMLGGRFVDSAFWLWNDHCAVMNDVQEETFSWSEPNDVFEFIGKLKLLNEKPMPLPMVYLFPTSSTLELSKFEDRMNNKNYAEISLPFKFVIDNIDRFVDLGGSEKYIRNLKNELSECTVIEEVHNIIDEKINIDQEKGFREMKHKIHVIFDNLFDEGILNLSSSIPSVFAVDNYQANPFSVLMRAGAVPSLVTSDLDTKRYKDKLLAYYINLLFRAQLNEFKNERVWLYFDELTKVCSTEDSGHNEAEEELNHVATRGRLNKIGLVYATQNYSKIPKIIRSQTKYSFLFKHGNNDEELRVIANDFSLSRTCKESLKKLKTYECIAATKDYFKIYNTDGDIAEAEGPIKGTILPPLHKNKYVK